MVEKNESHDDLELSPMDFNSNQTASTWSHRRPGD